MDKSFILKKFKIDKLCIKVDKKQLIKKGEKRAQQIPINKITEYHPVKRNAVKMICAQESHMIPQLLPLRHKRMMQNYFSFLRGTVEVMVYDFLHTGKQTNIPVMICGDAHLNNFGFFASPERDLLFGLNDFDEARVGNWEFDLKRLMVSADLAGEINGYSKHDVHKILKKTAKSYKKGIKHANSLKVLKRYYRSYNIKDLLEFAKGDKQMRKILKKIAKKAPHHNSNQVVKKHTEMVNGELRFKVDPPRAKKLNSQEYKKILDAFNQYRKNVSPAIRVLLSNFKVIDIIRYSVGVGSFGTRCYLVLLKGKDGSNLVLQIKEAVPCKYELLSMTVDEAKAQEAAEGKRVITGQEILQTFFDPFLGYTKTSDRCFYVRQFRDMKDSIDLTKLDKKSFGAYTRLCAFVLAAAHYQSPTAPMIYGYIKKSKKFSKKMTNWAEVYSEQVRQDYKAFKKYLHHA